MKKRKKRRSESMEKPGKIEEKAEEKVENRSVAIDYRIRRKTCKFIPSKSAKCGRGKSIIWRNPCLYSIKLDLFSRIVYDVIELVFIIMNYHSNVIKQDRGASAFAASPLIKA